MDHFENYINAIDIDYDSEHVTFTGYIYKLNTPQFNGKKYYGKGTNYMQKLFNIMDKTVTYQLLECVSSNVTKILQIKIIQKF